MYEKILSSALASWRKKAIKSIIWGVLCLIPFLGCWYSDMHGDAWTFFYLMEALLGIYIIDLIGIVGAYLIVVKGIWVLVTANKKHYENELMHGVSQYINLEAIKRELENVNTYAFHRVLIGDHYTFINILGRRPRVIENHKIRWVYSKDGLFNDDTAYLISAIFLAIAGFILISFSAFGGNNHPPRVLYLYTEDKDKPYKVGVGRWGFYLDEIFTELQHRCPNLEIGYSKYRKEEFKKKGIKSR